MSVLVLLGWIESCLLSSAKCHVRTLLLFWSTAFHLHRFCLAARSTLPCVVRVASKRGKNSAKQLTRVGVHILYFAVQLHSLTVVTYLLTYLLTYLPIYLFTYVPTYLLIYLLTYLLIYVPTYLFTYLRTYLPTYLFTYLPAYLFTYVPTYLLIYLLIYVPIYLPTYLFTYVPT